MTTAEEAVGIVADLVTFFQPPAMNQQRVERYARQICEDMANSGAAVAAAQSLIRCSRRWPSYADLLESYREQAGTANPRNNMSPQVADCLTGPTIPTDQVRSILSAFRARFASDLDASPIGAVVSPPTIGR